MTASGLQIEGSSYTTPPNGEDPEDFYGPPINARAEADQGRPNTARGGGASLA